MRTHHFDVAWAAFSSTAFGVAFSRDDRTVLSGGGDTAVLQWDVTGRIQGGKFAALDLLPAELKAAWDDVIAEDGAKDAVEVEAREAGNAGDVLQPERLIEVARDVVDGPVDAAYAVHIRKIWQVAHGRPIVTSCPWEIRRRRSVSSRSA